MLKIKLARFGKRHQAHFRMVVNEARDKRDGKYVAMLGHYAPTYEQKILEIDTKAYDEWIKKGAQPTETVAALYERFKSGNPFPKKKAKLSKKAKAKLAETKAQKETAKKEAEEAKAAPVKEEAPAVEKVEEKSVEVKEEVKTEEKKEEAAK